MKPATEENLSFMRLLYKCPTIRGRGKCFKAFEEAKALRHLFLVLTSAQLNECLHFRVRVFRYVACKQVSVPKLLAAKCKSLFLEVFFFGCSVIVWKGKQAKNRNWIIVIYIHTLYIYKILRLLIILTYREWYKQCRDILTLAKNFKNERDFIKRMAISI